MWKSWRDCFVEPHHPPRRGVDVNGLYDDTVDDQYDNIEDDGGGGYMDVSAENEDEDF